MCFIVFIHIFEHVHRSLFLALLLPLLLSYWRDLAIVMGGRADIGKYHGVIVCYLFFFVLCSN